MQINFVRCQMFRNIFAEPMKITTAFMLGGLTVLGAWMLTNRQMVMRKGKCLMEEGLNMMDNMTNQCCSDNNKTSCNQ